MNVVFLNSFLNQLEEFLDDLRVLLPMWDDVLAIRKTVELGRPINPRAILDGYMDYISPYYQHIFLRNEEFLLNPENIVKDKNFQNVDEATYQDNYSKMFQLKDVWQQFNGHNRHTIWEYFCSLMLNGARGSNHPEHKVILKWFQENETKIREAAKRTAMAASN